MQRLIDLDAASAPLESDV